MKTKITLVGHMSFARDVAQKGGQEEGPEEGNLRGYSSKDP